MRASCPVMMSTLAFEYINENERNIHANNCWKKSVGRYLHEIDVDVNIDDYGSINGMKASKATCIEPWVFAACGHVHGYSESLEGGNCPLCRCVSPFVSIQMPKKFILILLHRILYLKIFLSNLFKINKTYRIQVMKIF